MTDGSEAPPALHLVAPPTTEGTTGDASTAADAEEQAPSPDEARDPLLARAERIADLPLAERPAAFDGLNRAVVAELNTLEEG